jgi:hypothetical protein
LEKLSKEKKEFEGWAKESGHNITQNYTDNAPFRAA